MDARSLVQTVLSGKDRPFGVRLWDGTVIPPHHAAAFRCWWWRNERGAAAFAPPTEEKVAEAFLAGDLEVEGDLADFIERAASWPGPETLPATALAAGLVAEVGARAGELLRSATRHSIARDDASVRHHYDVGNDFYRLFLDEQMVYSCAYWAPGAERLDIAQLAKLELICRKLGLHPGQRFLDVGCGWGALIAHATRGARRPRHRHQPERRPARGGAAANALGDASGHRSRPAPPGLPPPARGRALGRDGLGGDDGARGARLTSTSTSPRW